MDSSLFQMCPLPPYTLAVHILFFCIGFTTSQHHNNHAYADGVDAPAESSPVIGGATTDTTFTACVHRTTRAPEFSPPVGDMAESTDHGTCMLCFQPDFHPGPDFSDRTMIVCDSCEREYHVGCLRECGYSALHHLPAGEWFCSQTCFAILKEVRGALLPTNSMFWPPLGLVFLVAGGCAIQHRACPARRTLNFWLFGFG